MFKPNYKIWFTSLIIFIVLTARISFAAGGDTWETKAPMSNGRYGAAGGVINDILYTAGGNDGSTDTNTLQAYNPSNNVTTNVIEAYTPLTTDYPSGMVSLWKLDEGSGNTAYDSAGTNHGTIYGATWTTDGISLNFDGVDDYIDCGKSDDFNFGNGNSDKPFTFGAWIKRNGSGVILSKYQSNITPLKQQYIFDINAEGCLDLYIFDASGNDYRKGVKTKSSITTDWHYVVGTYDGSSKISGLKLYVDGIEKEIEVVYDNSNYVAMGIKDIAFKIGRCIDSVNEGEFINGIIDEVQIYKRNLTATEIMELYQSKTINTYIITATAGSGGSISPSGTVTVNYNADQTFTITPDHVYHIEDVKVDNISKGAIPTYTFENVTTNHIIEVLFEQNVLICGGVQGGYCFISRIAVKTGYTQNIKTLNIFRDRWLLQNNIGRKSAELYYKISSSLVKLFE